MVHSLFRRFKISSMLSNKNEPPLANSTRDTSLPPKGSRESARQLVLNLQDEICNGLEKIDKQGKFQE